MPRPALTRSLHPLGRPRSSLSTPASSRPSSSRAPLGTPFPFDQSRPILKPSTWSLLYPFLLLSTVTSLALNLSHSRQTASSEHRRLSAQVSVLSALVSRLSSRDGDALSEDELEAVERELEMVGLGRGRGKEGQFGAEVEKGEAISWGEVLFGKKGKRYELKEEDTDWDKLFEEADLAEKNRRQGPAAPARPVEVPAVAAERLPSSAPLAVEVAPSRPKSSKPAVYL